MRRTRWAWLILCLCLALLLGVMVWVTRTLNRLDRREVERRHRASRQASLRLVLWRLDAFMTDLIAREDTRNVWSPGARTCPRATRAWWWATSRFRGRRW